MLNTERIYGDARSCSRIYLLMEHAGVTELREELDRAIREDAELLGYPRDPTVREQAQRFLRHDPSCYGGFQLDAIFA